VVASFDIGWAAGCDPAQTRAWAVGGPRGPRR